MNIFSNTSLSKFILCHYKITQIQINVLLVKYTHRESNNIISLIVFIFMMQIYN